MESILQQHPKHLKKLKIFKSNILISGGRLTICPLSILRKSALCFIIILYIGLTNLTAQNVYPLDSDFVKPSELVSQIEAIVNIDPSICSYKIIGYSTNDKLPIYAIIIGKKSDDGFSFLMTGQLHSEEVIGPQIVLNNAKKILEEYQDRRKIQKFLNNNEFCFIPTLNPEGFQIVNSGTFRSHRKNKTDSNGNGKLEYFLDGVDLNRNFPFNWEGGDNVNLEGPYFKGVSPASETETQALIAFAKEHKFAVAITYHSSITGTYNEKIFFPWNWKGAKSPDYKGMQIMATLLSDKLPKDYARGNYLVYTGHTGKVGFLRDYLYATYGTFAFDIEVGGVNADGVSVINPPNEMLRKILKKHYNAFKALIDEMY